MSRTIAYQKWKFVQCNEEQRRCGEVIEVGEMSGRQCTRLRWVAKEGGIGAEIGLDRLIMGNYG